MLATVGKQVENAPLHFETRNYLIRSLTKSDVTDGWCEWLTDPATAELLNAECRALKRSELEAYIATFDDRNRTLLGIFHRQSSHLIGVMTVLASRTRQDALINLIIGEEGFRTIGSIFEMREVRTAVANYVFFDRGFRAMCASVVAHNKPVIAFLRLTGWEVLQRTVSKPSPDGRAVDLILFRLTKESYVRREGQSWTTNRRAR